MNTSFALAYNIRVEGAGELKNCLSNGSDKIFYCNNEKGEEFLIKEKDWEFIALKKESSGKFSSAEVYNITDDAGKYIFTARFDRDAFLAEEVKSPYVGPLNDYVRTEKYLYSNFFKDEEKDIESKSGKLEQFYKKTKLELENIEKEVKESINSNSFNIRLKDGQEVECSANKNKECPLLNCSNDSEGIKRVLLKVNNSSQLYIEPFGFKDNNFITPKNSMTGIYEKNGKEIISYAPQERGKINPEMIVPSNFRNNPRLFNDLINPNFKGFIASSLKSCDKKQSKIIKDIVENTLANLQNEKMFQYINMANGILESNYINQESIPGSACLHRGVYYEPDGYRKSLETQRMSRKTISLDRARDLIRESESRPDISWTYTMDGCYARAHLMTKSFEDQGIHVEKAWLRGKLRIPGMPVGTNWGYHVAPLVYVEDEKGNVQEMIIDPSISDDPMTPKEWAKTMDVNYNETEQVAFPTPANTANFNKTSYSVTNSTPYWPDYNGALTADEKIEMATKTMIDYGAQPDFSQDWQEENQEWSQWEQM